MKEHWKFLKESDHSLGLFYPLHYTIAAFDTLERAELARGHFLANGFHAGDVAAVSGPFVINHLESEQGANLYDKACAYIARVLGTEAGFLDDDIHVARRGGAFLFVYTPTHELAEHARALIRWVHPVFARRYHRMGIENIRYPPQSTL